MTTIVFLVHKQIFTQTPPSCSHSPPDGSSLLVTCKGIIAFLGRETALKISWEEKFLLLSKQPA